MITLLYHARTNGFVCDRIARASEGEIVAVCDKTLSRTKVPGTLIRWDSCVELDADKTINTAAAVKMSRDKRESRVLLQGLCPETWLEEEDLQYPCIIRPKRHHAAVKFYVCHNVVAARKAIRRCRVWYASPIIPKTFEYRVFVFQDHVVKIIRRYPADPTQIAWNAAEGGLAKRILRTSWPISAAKICIEAGRRFGLDWYAADVIGDAENAYVLELNTAPGLEIGRASCRERV